MSIEESNPIEEVAFGRWHHGPISRKCAEALLSGSPNGVFLVRESTCFPGHHTLCVRFRGNVIYYLVKWATGPDHQNQRLTIDDEEFFDNLNELIQHYMDDADGLCTKLVKYIPNPSPNGANNYGVIQLQQTLKYYSDKIDDYEVKMKNYEKANKVMENRCKDLQNNYKSINIKYEVLECKLNQLEQCQLANQLEICGIEESEKEDVGDIAKEVANIIAQSPEDIVKAYRKTKTRKHGQTSKTNSVITVILREGIRDMWIEANKSTPIQAEKLGLAGNSKIYLRESLTPAIAFLLWKTKDELKGVFKFIWCKHGSILIRKNEKDKIEIIRSVNDIMKVKSSQENCK